jgi:large subunit ribosomal protein L12
MEYVYSAMLLHSAGQPINEENVKKVLTAAGVKTDAARVKALVASLEGVNIDEAIKAAAIPVERLQQPQHLLKRKRKRKKKRKKKFLKTKQQLDLARYLTKDAEVVSIQPSSFCFFSNLFFFVYH